MKVRAMELIPEQYFDGNRGFISKSHHTRIKDHLTLVNATWMASDGKCFDDVKEAFEYEENIYKTKNTIMKLQKNNGKCGVLFNAVHHMFQEWQHELE